MGLLYYPVCVGEPGLELFLNSLGIEEPRFDRFQLAKASTIELLDDFQFSDPGLEAANLVASFCGIVGDRGWWILRPSLVDPMMMRKAIMRVVCIPKTGVGERMVQLVTVAVRRLLLICAVGVGGNLSLVGNRSDKAMLRVVRATYLLRLRSIGPTDLDAIAAFDHIRLERNGPRAAMELEVQATGIAQYGTRLIATPQGRGGCAAILTCGLCDLIRFHLSQSTW
jgi:hypothetical protein